MKIQLHSTKNGELITNHTYAHEIHGVDVTILSIRDLDQKYTPIDVAEFDTWKHAYGINGKSCWFCELL